MNPSLSSFFIMKQIPSFQGRIEIWAVLGCLVLFASLVELIRRNQLKERYSLLWFLTCAVLLVFTIRRSWLEDFSKIVGVYYPPTALFLLLVFFMLLILVHFSTVISSLLNDKQILTQQLGIVEARVRDLENQLKSSNFDSNLGPNLVEDTSSTED